MKTRWHKFKFWLAMRLVALGKRWAEEAMFPDPKQRARFHENQREQLMMRGFLTQEQIKVEADSNLWKIGIGPR